MSHDNELSLHDDKGGLFEDNRMATMGKSHQS